MIQSGAFESHVRAMRMLYRRRQDALVRHIRPALDGQLDIEVLNAGLHLIGWLPEGSDDWRLAESVRRRRMRPRPMSDYDADGSLRPALMLGFSNLAEERGCRPPSQPCGRRWAKPESPRSAGRRAPAGADSLETACPSERADSRLVQAICVACGSSVRALRGRIRRASDSGSCASIRARECFPGLRTGAPMSP